MRFLALQVPLPIHGFWMQLGCPRSTIGCDRPRSSSHLEGGLESPGSKGPEQKHLLNPCNEPQARLAENCQ